jgi:hypothetical protein
MKSHELYFDHPPGNVLETNHLRDVNAGIYPCYYTITNGTIVVSTSVTEIISYLGDFIENPDYEMDNFTSTGSTHDRTLFNWLKTATPSRLKDTIPSEVKALIKRGTGYEKSWHEGRETVDERIYRLRPFENISLNERSIDFSPDFSLSTVDVLVERAADCLTEYVRTVEKEYTNHHHIILMGGKDSQILGLIPKVDNDNWSVFSAVPNYALAENFISDNGIELENLYRHDNRNREDETDLIRKLICSDLRADPRHIRWRKCLKEIADSFGSECIFWVGTEADTIFSHFPEFHEQDRSKYFEGHFTRAANWQGTTHQTTKNFTGSPMISPYHSERFWRQIMEHYDPRLISKGTDLRKRLGEEIAGQSVVWPAKNPGPDMYKYDYTVNGYQEYIDYVREITSNPEARVI